MRTGVGVILMIAGAVLGAWLGGYVMLYGGIASAIAHLSAGAILRALFFEAGLIPGYLLICFGIAIINEDIISWYRHYD